MAGSRPSSGSFTLPGKVFLLGEYAVLTGLPALHAAIGPRFQLVEASETSHPHSRSPFHPDSPAGKLLSWADQMAPSLNAGALTADWNFVDPWHGVGGFGASTAQFALLYRMLAGKAGWDLSWSSVWKLYRELTRREPELLSPSGADLVSQWQGGVTWFDPRSSCVEDLSSCWDISSLMVFLATHQAGRKVATHEHLGSLANGQGPQAWAELAGRWAGHLEHPLRAGISAARAGDLIALGSAMDHYADALNGLGLEVGSTTQDRQAIRKIPGVLGVKGTGALQSDVILVLLDPRGDRESARRHVRGVAEAQGLRWVCNGLERQEGIS